MGVLVTNFLLILGMTWLYVVLPLDGSSGDDSLILSNVQKCFYLVSLLTGKLCVGRHFVLFTLDGLGHKPATAYLFL